MSSSGGGLVALGEVGKGLRLREGDSRVGHAFAVWTVARHAGGLEDFLAVVKPEWCGSVGLTPCEYGQNGEDKRSEEAMYRTALQCRFHPRSKGQKRIIK